MKQLITLLTFVAFTTIFAGGQSNVESDYFGCKLSNEHRAETDNCYCFRANQEGLPNIQIVDRNPNNNPILENTCE